MKLHIFLKEPLKTKWPSDFDLLKCSQPTSDKVSSIVEAQGDILATALSSQSKLYAVLFKSSTNSVPAFTFNDHSAVNQSLSSAKPADNLYQSGLQQENGIQQQNHIGIQTSTPLCQYTLMIISFEKSSVKALKEFSSTCTTFEFHNNNENLLFAVTDNVLHLINIDRNDFRLFYEHTLPILGIFTCQKSNFLVSRSISEVFLWDTVKFELLQKLNVDKSSKIVWAGYSFCVNSIVIAFDKGTVMLRSLESSSENVIIPANSVTMDFQTFCLSNSGDQLVGFGTDSFMVIYCLKNKGIDRIFRYSSMLSSEIFNIVRVGFFPHINVNIDPSTEIMYICTERDFVVLDFNNLTMIKSLKSHHYFIRDAAISPDGLFLSLTYSHGVAKIYPILCFFAKLDFESHSKMDQNSNNVKINREFESKNVRFANNPLESRNNKVDSENYTSLRSENHPFRSENCQFRGENSPFSSENSPFRGNHPFRPVNHPFISETRIFRGENHPFKEGNHPFRPVNHPFGSEKHPVRSESYCNPKLKLYRPMPSMTKSELPFIPFKSTFKTEKWLNILEEFGEYPERYRHIIWTSLLQLPRNFSIYDELLHQRSSEHLNFFESEQFLHHSSVDVSHLKSLVCCLYAWSPHLKCVHFVPDFVLPILQFSKRNDLLAFEMSAVLLYNWCRFWYESEDMSLVLRCIEELLSGQHSDLFLFFVKINVNVLGLVWNMMKNCFSRVFDSHRWLILMDHVISKPPSFFACIGPAFILCQANTFLACESHSQVELIFEQYSWLSIGSLMKKSEDLSNLIPLDGKELSRLKRIVYMPADGLLPPINGCAELHPKKMNELLSVKYKQAPSLYSTRKQLESIVQSKKCSKECPKRSSF